MPTGSDKVTASIHERCDRDVKNKLTRPCRIIVWTQSDSIVGIPIRKLTYTSNDINIFCDAHQQYLVFQQLQSNIPPHFVVAYSLNVKDTVSVLEFVLGVCEEQLEGSARPEAFQVAGTNPLLAADDVTTDT